jgi:hypothetical protein
VTLLLAPLLLTVAMVLSSPAHAASNPPGPSRGVASPVNLSTPVDMAGGLAHPSAIVRLGRARIEVLSPTLLRLEYSPTGHFENSPTVNALTRRMPVPAYTAAVSQGWLTLRTSEASLRYKVGSGPFTPANTSLRLAVGNLTTTVHPTWEWECPFDQTCQAGAAVVAGGASLSQGPTGYQSSAGSVGYLDQPGASATWSVLGATAGQAALTVRYSELVTVPQTIDLVVNGQLLTTVVAPPTDPAHPWSTLMASAVLKAGSNSVAMVCGTGERCNLNIDTLTVGPASAPVSPPLPNTTLGGWIRGFDTFTYGPGMTCPPGVQDATCEAALEPLHPEGLLDSAGWRLIDDTASATWTGQGWVKPRGPGGDLEDGYLFAYGHNYAGALRTFAQLTGPAPLLPRSLFGVWYSDYTPYSSSAIEGSLYPAFQSHRVPLDTLSLDTDWKAPTAWNGWEWNTTLFPDPGSFLRWARARGIDVTLNIHSSIADNDPKLPAAERIAGTALASSTCSAGPCRVWDWSTVSQAESNFALQQSFRNQGVAFWWLDWCCDESIVSAPGLTPDSWIGHLYAQEMVNKGQRGFVLARIGASNDFPQEVYPAGPWSDHTSAIAFTCDAWGTWNTLSREVALTPDEATIGQPYVSNDIGSFLGAPGSAPQVPADLYDRWVQFGTFQPILRLHSANGNRLPWQFPPPVSSITEDFLRLREALLPYTYTLAAQAHHDGLPMARPLYLQYPGQSAAYANPGEYLYGSDVLVAPVTSPGSVADATVWIPPGRWVDYFTGATFTGPMTTTVAVPLSRMPVFVRAGGIVPEQPPSTSDTTATSTATSTGTSTATSTATSTGTSTATSTAPAPATQLVIKLFSGSSGRFDLYGDSGTGTGYASGQHADTLITDSVGAPAGPGATASRITIGPARGHYPGAPSASRYRLEMVDLTQPTRVTLNGHTIERRPSGSAGPGWYYEVGTATVVVDTPSLPANRTTTVLASGTLTVNRPEPPAASP